MSEKPARPRNARVEALRLAAIAGIAVFHTFQPWFSAATDGSWAAGPATLAALGLVSLLGSFGNSVFFLVSGFYLVPRAARAAREEGYWGRQARATLRRAVPVLLTVALYALAALAVSAWVAPIEGVSPGRTDWLVGGLEFVWVYLALVAATPVMGWVWARVRRPRAAVGAVVAAVLLVNAYIAFVSPGSEVRGLLEWRKLMSAATYLAAYLVGGALGERPGRLPRAPWPLACALLACVAAEAVAAATGSLGLLAALSFKSTSALSFALAVTAVMWAARPGEAPDGPLARAVRFLTPSILGFYVGQSVFSPLWRPAGEALCARALQAGGEGALLAASVAWSLALLLAALLADRLVRVPLLARVRAGRKGR